MFDKNLTVNSLYGLVGCDNPTNPVYAILDTDNLVSRSGYKATDNTHVKVELIKDSQDYKDISDVDFNIFLRKVQENSIASVCNSVFSEPDFIDRNPLFGYPTNNIDVESLPSGAVGYKIEVDKKKNVAFEIKRVILNFQGTGDIKVLLFNSSVPTPIQERTISINSTNQEEQLNWVVNNTGGVYQGEYYLVYLTDSLTVAPFKRNYENADCKNTIEHLCIEEIKIDNHNTETLFDLRSVDYTNLTNGLNPDFVVYDDYTDFIIQNERLFAKAINLEFQIRLISLGLSSLRSNRNERVNERLVVLMLQEIEGETGEGMVKFTGLKPSLLQELKRIKSEIKKLQNGLLGSGIFVGTAWV